jgi:hypothetical protein
MIDFTQEKSRSSQINSSSFKSRITGSYRFSSSGFHDLAGNTQQEKAISATPVLMFLCVLILIILLSVTRTHAQNGNVGIGTRNPDPKAILDIRSTDKGVMIPRLTNTERDALQKSGSMNAAINGMMIYNTTDSAFNYWSYDRWMKLAGNRKDFSFGSAGDSVVISYSDGTKEVIKLPPGKDGVGVKNTLINTDSTMTIIYTNGAAFTTLHKVIAAKGPTGPVGPKGADGKGIAYTLINTDSTMTIKYTDSTSFTTAKKVIGPKGANGANGRGVAYTLINTDSTMTIKYTDSTSFTTAKKVIGPKGANGANGRGVAYTLINTDSTMTIKYTDSTSFTTAKKVIGPKGADGTNGKGIAYTLINTDSTMTIKYTDSTSFTTAKKVIGPKGADGATGTKGADGRGIAYTRINSDSTMTIKYTDSTSFTMVQKFIGPRGGSGSNGADGRGIAYTRINTDSTMTIKYTDSTFFTTLHKVIGPRGATGATGKGIAYTVINTDSTMTIKYTDSTSFTTAKKVIGTKGTDGAKGVGIAYTRINADSTLTVKYTDSTSFTSIQKVVPQNGENGTGISWKGTLTSHPASPSVNWAYYNSADKQSYIFNGTTWEILARDGDANAWNLYGNANTNEALQFIGTTDLHDLKIRTNSIERMVIMRTGQIGIGNDGTMHYPTSNSTLSVLGRLNVHLSATTPMPSYDMGDLRFIWRGPNFYNGNTLVGMSTGNETMSGTLNSVFGDGAGRYLSTGGGNTFVGNAAGQQTLSGSSNAFFGAGSGSVNTTGSYNTFAGSSAGSSNSTGEYNVFIGNSAGSGNSSGNNNVYIGNNASGNGANRTGSVAVGDGARVSGNNATAIGKNAHAGSDNTLVLGSTGLEAVNVGINTTTPSRRLDVNGNARIGTNGTTITNIMLAKNVSLAVPAMPPGATTTVDYFGLPSATVGSVVHVSPRSELNGSTVISSVRVSSAGTIRIKFVNPGSTAAPASTYDFDFSVIE